MAATSEAFTEVKASAKPSIWRRATSFGRLLFYAVPSSTDLIILLVGFLAAVASGVPFPIMSIVFGQLVNGLNSATCEIDPSTAATYQDGINSKILLIVYVGIAYFALIYIHTICWNVFSERLAQRIREAYFSAILRQDAAFFDNLPAGEVSARITDEISVVQQGTNEKVGIVISSVSFVITAYVVAFIKNPKLAGMLVSLTPAYLIMALGGGYFVQKYVGHSMSTMAKASSVALEAISNTMVVHTFSANARLEEKFVEVLTPALWAGVRKSVAVALQAGLLYFIAFSANALAFWQGSRQIASAVELNTLNTGGITVGATFTVMLVLIDASLVLSQAAPFLRSFDAGSVAFAKLETAQHGGYWGDLDLGRGIVIVNWIIILRNSEGKSRKRKVVFLTVESPAAVSVALARGLEMINRIEGPWCFIMVCWASRLELPLSLLKDTDPILSGDGFIKKTWYWQT